MKTMLKRKKKTRLIKYFTKAILQKAARNAEKWDYNRQLDLNAINSVPDARIPVCFSMPHEHRHGEPAETHVRAMVVMDDEGGIAFVDMPVSFWNALPVKRVAA